ncbi:MAG: hypothetical protein AB7G06_01410 [Bdellovibrionales bacterium]
MLWILCGLASALCSATGGIIAERSKTHGDAMAVWFRIVSIVVTLPFILTFELPTAWQFWALVVFNSIIMGISDTVSFHTIKVIGAGAQSRYRRTAILITFVLWLLINPALLYHYLEMPGVSAAIFIVHALAVYFAVRLKRDQTSWDGLRMMWVPILAGSIAPIVTTLSFDYVANPSQGVFAYIFIQAVIVMGLFTARAAFRNGLQITKGAQALLADGNWKPGAAVGLALVAALALKNYGYSAADNPAYIAVLLLTDTLWLLLYHKWRGIKDKTDVISGMGIVGCAAALILIKITFE